MASLLEKVGVLVRANLHALVDEALKKNSVAVLDEYIRQAENNLEDLEDAAATVGGNVRTLERKHKEYQSKAPRAGSTLPSVWPKTTRSSGSANSANTRHLSTPSSSWKPS
jgi:hypothetical protein